MKWLKNFFITTSSERNGFFVLLSIIACLSIYYIVKHLDQPQVIILEDNSNVKIPITDSIVIDSDQKSYFKFDPNELGISGWKELGFTEKQARTILKFSYSIGGFKKHEDLLSCYVIDSTKYFELKPYVNFNNEKKPKELVVEDINLNSYGVFLLSSLIPLYDGFESFENLYFLKEGESYQYYSSISEDSLFLINDFQLAKALGFNQAKIEKINDQKLRKISPEIDKLDVNVADSIELCKLYGIGPVLSNRIIKFRQKLGGFVHLTQIKEVYGLKPETYQKIERSIEIKDTVIVKLNINQCSVEEFKAHPYFNWNLSNAIVNYRQQHGQYISIEKIKSIHLVNEEIYRKIAPYLTIE